MNIVETIKELKKPFPAADHQERTIPGNSRWFYIPWQKIRDRLDDVCPGWSVVYSDPISCDGLTVVRCRLAIDGVSREGVGNSDNGKGYGTPVERATADAFKNAAEAFGVGAYLDNQDFVVRYLQSQGDGRGVQFTMRDTPGRSLGHRNGEKSQHYKRNSSRPIQNVNSSKPEQQTSSEAWRDWKSEADAIAWAKTHLSRLNDQTLKTMFAQTPPDPDTGKKAVAWMNRVLAASEF